MVSIHLPQEQKRGIVGTILIVAFMVVAAVLIPRLMSLASGVRFTAAIFISAIALGIFVFRVVLRPALPVWKVLVWFILSSVVALLIYWLPIRFSEYLCLSVIGVVIFLSLLTTVRDWSRSSQK